MGTQSGKPPLAPRDRSAEIAAFVEAARRAPAPARPIAAG